VIVSVVVVAAALAQACRTPHISTRTEKSTNAASFELTALNPTDANSILLFIWLTARER